jgi:hypothetical protein
MPTSATAERTRLFVMTDAEVKTNRAEDVSAVRESIFSYLSEKLPGLPNEIFEVDSYDHESGMLSTEYLQTSSLRIWSGRFTEPDSAVAGRSWSLELTVSEFNGRQFFDSRLSCFSRHLDFYFDPAVPRVYRDLVSRNILFGDGIRLSRRPIDVTNEDDIAWLVALINNPRRMRNIIVLSCDSYGDCADNPNLYADRLCGVAHVVRIYPSASFGLSNTIGKHLSVFDSGIRNYTPTSQIDIDDPLRHTLYTKHALARTDLSRVQHSILSSAFTTSVEGALRSRSIPTFVQIRSANAALKIAQPQSTEIASLEVQLKASQAARFAAETQARDSLDLAIQEEAARKEAEDERNQERARAIVLSARVRALESRLVSVTDADMSRPEEYGEVATWVEREFAGRMKLHPRALRGLKNATFGLLRGRPVRCRLLDRVDLSVPIESRSLDAQQHRVGAAVVAVHFTDSQPPSGRRQRGSNGWSH